MQRTSEGDCVGRQEQVENVGPSVQDEKSGAHAFAHRFSPSTLMKFPLLISMLLQERNAAESDGDREWHVSFSRKYRHVLLKKTYLYTLCMWLRRDCRRNRCWFRTHQDRSWGLRRHTRHRTSHLTFPI